MEECNSQLSDSSRIYLGQRRRDPNRQLAGRGGLGSGRVFVGRRESLGSFQALWARLAHRPAHSLTLPCTHPRFWHPTRQDRRTIDTSNRDRRPARGTTIDYLALPARALLSSSLLPLPINRFQLCRPTYCLQMAISTSPRPNHDGYPVSTIRLPRTGYPSITCRPQGSLSTTPTLLGNLQATGPPSSRNHAFQMLTSALCAADASHGHAHHHSASDKTTRRITHSHITIVSGILVHSSALLHMLA